MVIWTLTWKRMNIHDVVLTLSVLCCLVLAGCTNPYETVDEQKKQIDEPVTKLDKCNLESQEKCAKGAKQAFYDSGYGKGKDIDDYVCHYNKKLIKCFIEITSISHKTAGIFHHRHLYDTFERKEYAGLLKLTPKGKKLSEEKILSCQMLDNKCKSEKEYTSFVKSYLEE